MQLLPINHAVSLQPTDTCPVCSVLFTDFIGQKKDLLIIRCGHVYDRACLEQMMQEAVSQRKLPVCVVCKAKIDGSDVLCKNIWTNCIHHTKLHEKIPADIRISMDHMLELLITNCGHLLHAICWIEILEQPGRIGAYGSCPICEKPIKAMQRFALRPSFAEKTEVDVLIEDFEVEKMPTPGAQKLVQTEKVVDEFELI